MDRQVETPAITPTNPSLLRALGPVTAIAVVVGNVIGSGIFLKPGNIAAASGNFPLIIGTWVFGGVLCILGALCIAELGAMLPRAGGLYVYLREAYGDLVAFLFGWTEMLFLRPAGIGALAVAFVGSMTLGLAWHPPVWVEVLLSIALILGLAWINILGVTWGGNVQLVTTILKAGFLALVALSPFVLSLFVSTAVNPANYRTHVKPMDPSLATQVGVVLLAVMWAYNGWHGITPLAEEVREPQKNIPLALFGGIGILIVLYVGANFAYHGVLSMQEMAGSGDHAAETMLKKLAGPAGVTAMALVIMCSTFGAINTNLMNTPRVIFAMARDGLFFRSLSIVHANYRTPVFSILLASFMAIVLVVSAAVAKFLFRDVESTSFSWELGRRLVTSLQQGSIFSLLTNLAIFAASIFYMLSVLAVVVLRLRRPELERPYRTWGYPVVPLLFVGTYLWFLWEIYKGSPLESHTGLVLIALGLPVFLWFRSRRAFTETS